MPGRPPEDLSQVRQEVGALVADLPMPELLDSREQQRPLTVLARLVCLFLTLRWVYVSSITA